MVASERVGVRVASGRIDPCASAARRGCCLPLDGVLGEREHRCLQQGGASMAWNLTGSYVETCSCELMCPCNLSFDHGATYDFCRVTLVFNIKQGQIDGTDIAGLTVGAIADTPKITTEGNWRRRGFVADKAR